MDTRPIGIFDSGIGGLTVLKQLKEDMPNESFIYLGDNLNFPYGEKSKEKIVELSRKNIQYFEKHNVKMVIIACGTATSLSLDIMNEIFSIPIIGIIEPTVQYIEKLKLKKVGVIATTGTIRSGMWEQKLKNKIPDIEVINKACPLLAGIAEEGKAMSEEGLKAIHEYMKIFKENNVETIILGCTHYPIYEEIIKREFPYEIELVNTGKAVSEKVREFLEEHKMTNDGKTKAVKIVLTKEEKDFENKAKKILKSSQMLDITIFN